MLPPGHIAGGYLTAEALLHFTHHAQLTSSQQNHLLWWGMFFGFAPDLDYFLAFAYEHSFTIKDFEKNSHRRFLTHAPILWLIAGLLIYFLAASVYVKYIGLLVWLGSWSHFVLDSFEYGVMWLWPISKKYYTFKKVEHLEVNKAGFFAYWWELVILYAKKSITFYIEILVILTALTVYFSNR